MRPMQTQVDFRPSDWAERDARSFPLLKPGAGLFAISAQHHAMRLSATRFRTARAREVATWRTTGLSVAV
jgi:hypothetical protein